MHNADARLKWNFIWQRCKSIRDICVFMITGSSNVLPDTLQKASIQVIGTAQCQNLVDGIGRIWENHICLYDSANNVGSCNVS